MIQGIILVAVDNEKVIGSIFTRKTKIGGLMKITLEIFGSIRCYEKDYRKSDIAKKLLNHFVKIVKEVKLQLRLDMFFSGDVVRKDKFYERKGFLRIGSIYIEG